jgi:uncharacterized protein (TIGR00369 family)
MNDVLDMARQVSEFATAKATLIIPIAENLKQQNGYVHGGVISYAADNALTFADATVLGVAVLTAQFKINYLTPAIGDALIARASVIHAGKRQAVCRCDIYRVKEGLEILCAVAQGTIVRIGNSETG